MKDHSSAHPKLHDDGVLYREEIVSMSILLLLAIQYIRDISVSKAYNTDISTVFFGFSRQAENSLNSKHTVIHINMRVN